jgi:hypothetical protein
MVNINVLASAANRNSLCSLLSVTAGAEIFRIVRISQFVKDKRIVKTNMRWEKSHSEFRICVFSSF